MARGNHGTGNHSRRSSKSQSVHVAKQLAAHGTARHGGGRDSGTVKSVGSERILKNDLSGVATWAAARGESLLSMTRQLAIEYLQHRAEAVGASQIKSDRESLNKLLALNGETEKLPVVRSELPAITHNKHYSEAQIAAIIQRQQVTNKNPAAALATKILAETGCRVHEIYSLRLADNGGQAADYRPWRDDRFAGRCAPGDVVYLCTGKGGLVREILLSQKTSAELELRRLPESEQVRDRGVVYHNRLYAIPGGNALSANFSRASKSTLGWTEGAHALRHSYVERRMTTLTEQLGYRYEEARLVVSQELGHFRPEILAAYGYP